ncbi:uncharacterized protein LOC116805712 isoform X2 [Drosophila grimshawi]|uniref:uncharacterized protein LOC116805712 isoform X2 n=1 Tax=Drosophila grimshawi TaxID=7222 RepID=UPI000C86E808|nr:uncharacterized protein LOC116805712 isoform X2 [Drosophila grimshawi]
MNSVIFSVSPKKMTFYAPYDRTQRRLITVMNPTDNRLFFKIRSNAPCEYNASPNCGCIEPYDFVEINISLHSFNFHKDLDYSHRFSVQCIRSPPAEQSLNQSIRSIFKQMHRSEIKSVPVPVDLLPDPILLSQDELDNLLQHNVQNRQWKSRLMCIDYINTLDQLPMPHKQKKRCKWTRFLMSLLIIISCLAGAYVHRLHIEDDLHMHIKMDNIQF